MKIESHICDLCGGSADKVMKFFNLDERVGRGAPKAFDVTDLCEFCYGEIVVFVDTLIRQANQ